jgi:3-dehydroquinate dehydratase
LAKTDEEQANALDRIEQRLDMLDDRIDNIDSIVSAVAERVMKQPITFSVTCNKCGNKIEVALIGIEKPTK